MSVVLSSPLHRNHESDLMLMCKVFDRFGEADCREALGEEALVISTSKVSIGTVDKRHLHVDVLGRSCSDLRNEPTEISGGRVILATDYTDIRKHGV